MDKRDFESAIQRRERVREEREQEERAREEKKKQELLFWYNFQDISNEYEDDEVKKTTDEIIAAWIQANDDLRMEDADTDPLSDDYEQSELFEDYHLYEDDKVIKIYNIALDAVQEGIDDERNGSDLFSYAYNKFLHNVEITPVTVPVVPVTKEEELKARIRVLLMKRLEVTNKIRSPYYKVIYMTQSVSRILSRITAEDERADIRSDERVTRIEKKKRQIRRILTDILNINGDPYMELRIRLENDKIINKKGKFPPPPPGPLMGMRLHPIRL